MFIYSVLTGECETGLNIVSSAEVIDSVHDVRFSVEEVDFTEENGSVLEYVHLGVDIGIREESCSTN